MNILKNKLFWGVLVVVLLIISAATVVKSGSKNDSKTVTASSGELVRTVAVSGKVVAENSADLAFEIGGTVAGVNKKVGDSVFAGDVLVSLDQASLSANLLKAQADLDAARAELAKLQGGLDSTAKLDTVKIATIQKIIDAYTTADDAIHNKVDQFFENPRTVNPEIITAFKDYDLRVKINSSRLAIGQTLNIWKSAVNKLSLSNYNSSVLDDSLKYSGEVMSFLDDIALAVSKLDSTEGLSQTIIDKYRTDVASARSSVNSASSALIAQGEIFNDTLAGVPVQIARVSSAQANVANYQASLSNASLRAPFSGIVSKQDAKIGQTVSPNTVITSVISKNRKIESYVPEVSIAELSIGNKAKVTLDAYGSEVVFNATITHIDPAETVRDGVSNYKIELVFSDVDDRVKPGMTTNITVETQRTVSPVVIPSRAVISIDGIKTVMVKSSTSVEKREVKTGLSDSNGNIEIVSGVNAGEEVLLDPTEK